MRRFAYAGALTLVGIATVATGSARLAAMTLFLLAGLLVPQGLQAPLDRLRVALLCDLAVAFSLWWMFDPVSGVSFILFAVVAVANLLLPRQQATAISTVVVVAAASFAPLHFWAKAAELPLFHRGARTVPEPELLVGIFTTALLLAALSMLFRSMADRLQEALDRREASEARFAAAFRHAPTGMLLLDRAGAVVDVNPAMAALLAIPPDSVIGTSLLAHLDQASRARLSEVLQQREPDHRELEGEVQGDHPKQVVISVTPMAAAGTRDLFIAQVVDVTDRLRAEEAIEHRLDFERVIRAVSSHLIEIPIEEADVGIDAALEAVGSFAGVDRAYVFQFDPSASTATNTHEWCAPGIPPAIEQLNEVRNDAFPWFASRILSGESVVVHHLDELPPEAGGEWENLVQQGVQSVMAVPMIGGGGVVGFVGFDWVRAPSPWSGDDIALARIVGEMISNTLQRRDAHLRLADLVRSKDEFVARVSHELRTPLTVVLGLAEELRSSQQPERDLLDLIADQSRELSYIVEDLLVAARAEIGALTIRPELLVLADEVHRSLLGLGHELDFRVEIGPTIRLWADPLRVRQVLRNLLTNAARYGGDRIRVTAAASGSQTVLTVADNGRGIPSDLRDRVFEPYVQANDTAGIPASMGLGLSVARSLARLMGGDLTYGFLDGWSRFALRLPSSNAAAGEAVPRLQAGTR